MPIKKLKSQNLKVKTITQKSKVVTTKKSSANLSVPVYSLAGIESGTLSLPKEVFGQKINKQLLAQAMRVYMTNQKTFTASTKTRGEVVGSTVKIYRQKGTGRARHGAIRAPIFVGGGITFGPKPRQIRLDLPKKMKKAALLSALSAKLLDKSVVGLSGLEKASGKTKEMMKLMSAVFSYQTSEKKQQDISALIITKEKQDNVVRAARNIPRVSILPTNLLNAYEVLKHNMLLITKEAVEKIGKIESGVKSLESTPIKSESSKETVVKSKRKGVKS